MSDHCVELLQHYFFSRTDKVAFRTSYGKPHPADAGESLVDLLTAHVRGKDVPPVTVHYRNGNGEENRTGHFRIGSYTPNSDGLTKWLCIDFDGGSDHPNGLIDPRQAVLLSQQRANDYGIPAYIECSGGGSGWHLWIFFDPMVPAFFSRQLGLLLCPTGMPLANGEFADASVNRGIEVFPKQAKIKPEGFGNLLWLPWWHHAKPGGNEFYVQSMLGRFDPLLPEQFETVTLKQIEQTLATHPRIAPESVPTRRHTHSAPQPHAAKTTTTEWDTWRKTALEKLSLEDVYGEFLTGNQSGAEWLECRDPSSPSGDRNPSAGVATGTGTVERGSFHSFLSGETISLFDFLIRSGKAKDFRDACNWVSHQTDTPLPVKQPSIKKIIDTLPDIVVNNRQLSAILSDTWNALVTANEPPSLFRRANHLLRIKVSSSEDKAYPYILDEVDIFGLLIRSAQWVRTTETGISDSYPPHDIARDITREIDERIPWFDAVVQTPVFAGNGTLLNSSGYYPHDKLFVHLPATLQGISVPPHPTKTDIDSVRRLLYDEVFVDFPFATNTDRSHAMAALLLPFVRQLIDGCTPLHLFESPVPGSGKGLLCNIISIVATGEIIAARTIPNDEDEFRKAITAELLKDDPIILLDNVNEYKTLNSTNLATVLTSTIWSDRLLGATSKISIRNQALWLMTGNNLKMALDLTRRMIRCRIDPHLEQPWLREKFRHTNLPLWVRQHRRELVQAILTMIQAWVDKGMPLFAKPLGSFENWSQVIGGILEVAGIPGFLGNLQSQYDSADSEHAVWREFVISWWEKYREKPVKVSDLNDFCETNDLLTGLRSDGSPRSQQTKLGNALRRLLERNFAGYRILQATEGVKQSRHNFYFLQLEPLENDSVNGADQS